MQMEVSLGWNQPYVSATDTRPPGARDQGLASPGQPLESGGSTTTYLIEGTA